MLNMTVRRAEELVKSALVPFGKYKGQSIEFLIADESYCEWVSAQAWFTQKYSDLAEVIRSGRLMQPQETPEHNAMVAGLIDRRDETEWLFSQIFTTEPYFKWYLAQFKQIVEPKGGDLAFVNQRDGHKLLIEAKPLIGDDFPNVIRQVKAVEFGKPVVVARVVEATNLTLDQVRRQFELAGVHLIIESDFLRSAELWRNQRPLNVANALASINEKIQNLQDNDSSENFRGVERAWEYRNHIARLDILQELRSDLMVLKFD